MKMVHFAGILCPELSAPLNGQVATGQLLSVGVVANYSCDNGYILVGDVNRRCEDMNRGTSGIWSGSMPECEGMYPMD